MASLPTRVQIVGELESLDDFVIQGEVRGNIHVPMGTVTIASQARVDADIRAKRVHVHGTVRGAISAIERIDIAASAIVTGSLSADYIVISEGAQVNGHIDMNRRTIASRLARHQAVAIAST